ncbi:hypothetical protein ACFL1B_04085 [Nanoarchaeota archaeon]
MSGNNINPAPYLTVVEIKEETLGCTTDNKYRLRIATPEVVDNQVHGNVKIELLGPPISKYIDLAQAFSGVKTPESELLLDERMLITHSEFSGLKAAVEEAFLAQNGEEMPNGLAAAFLQPYNIYAAELGGAPASDSPFQVAPLQLLR